MDGEACPMHEEHHGRRCHGPYGGSMRGFIQPWLLLQLLEKPGYGYALLERLAEGSAMTAADPGLVYRTLRQMEADGLVQSAWDTAGQGPARRQYEVTAEGIDALHGWAAQLAQTQQRLQQFMDQYQTFFGERI